jgi:UDP-glucose 4-epimerase
VIRSLITGGAGFIGSHLAERLTSRGGQVIVLDNESTGRLENLVALQGQPRFEFVSGSVADAALVGELVDRVDHVYHLAAAVGVELVARDPLGTIRTNIGPTEIVVAACQRMHAAGQRMRLFLASTSEVYGKNPDIPWREDADLVFGPTTRLRWSYGLSKAIDEQLALSAHKASGLPVVIGRFFNVVGPRQVGTYGMVLPRLAEAVLQGRAMPIHGDGLQTRCFAHVNDVIDAVSQLLTVPEAIGQVINIGSDEPVTIRDLAERVARLAGVEPKLTFVPYTSAYGPDFEDVRHRVPDVSRLRDLLGRGPHLDLDQTILAVLGDRRRALGLESLSPAERDRR